MLARQWRHPGRSIKAIPGPPLQHAAIKTMRNKSFPAEKAPFFACLLTTLLSLGCLFRFTYYHSFGDPALFNGDTLFPERLFRDLILEGGLMANWTFPMPAYWPDLGLYFLIRALTGDVSVAMAAYAAAQVTLLALALLYCVWPAVTAGTKAATPVFAALAAMGIAMGHGFEFQALRTPAMHGFTIVAVVFCMGLLLRLAAPGYGRAHMAAFFLAVGIGYASDGIFLIWFVIPAIVFLVFLVWRRGFPKRQAALHITCILLACLAGALCNTAFKPPTVDYSAVHISFFKSLRAIPAMAANLIAVLSPFPHIIAMCVATPVVAALCRKRIPGHFIALGIIMLFCTVSGIIANGHAKVSYILPVILVFPLFGVALLPACLPGRLTGWRQLIPGVAALLLLPVIWLQTPAKREPFSHPLARCIDLFAEKHALRNGVGTFWEASAAPLFTQSGIPFAASHVVHLGPYSFLMSTRHMQERYDMVILGTAPRAFGDMETMLLGLNGRPEETLLCPGTDAKLYAYPGKGARLPLVKDYLADTGKLETTRLERDTVVWQGNVPIADGMHLTAVSLRYRMNRIWTLLHFAEPPEALAGKTVTAYAASDRAKPAARLAGKFLSKTGDGAMDALWRRLAWDRAVTIGPETSAADANGGTFIYLEGPSRETKGFRMLLLEADGKRTRIK